MHLDTEQLLALRDASEESSASLHVRECESCAAQLRALVETRNALRDLPALEAPASAWQGIHRAVAGNAARGHAAARRPATRFVRAGAALAMAAGIAAIAVYVGTTTRNEVPDATMQLAQGSSTPETRAALAQWMEQSRHLDAVLQTLPNRPRVERVATAATLDTIEDRIEWLDYQLSYADSGQIDDARANALWRERVALMDSLITVRYAQVGMVSF